MRYLALLAGTLLASGYVAACTTEEVNTGGDGGTSAGGNTGGNIGSGGTGQGGSTQNQCQGKAAGFFGTDIEAACGSCVEGRCCAALQQCDPGTDCEALITCSEACSDGDTACQQACGTAHPVGLQALRGLLDCRDAGCETECAAPGLCGTELSYPDAAATNACLNTECCGTFTPCYNDVDCNACLQGSGTDCDNNALFQTYSTCFDGKCPRNFCGTTLSYPLPSCNACATTNCCTGMNDCLNGTLNTGGGGTGGTGGAAGGTGGNGGAGGSAPSAIDQCLACVNGPTTPACMAAPQRVQDGAKVFGTCLNTSCAAACGGS